MKWILLAAALAAVVLSRALVFAEDDTSAKTVALLESAAKIKPTRRPAPDVDPRPTGAPVTPGPSRYELAIGKELDGLDPATRNKRMLVLAEHLLTTLGMPGDATRTKMVADWFDHIVSEIPARSQRASAVITVDQHGRLWLSYRDPEATRQAPTPYVLDVPPIPKPSPSAQQGPSGREAKPQADDAEDGDDSEDDGGGGSGGGGGGGGGHGGGGGGGAGGSVRSKGGGASRGSKGGGAKGADKAASSGSRAGRQAPEPVESGARQAAHRRGAASDLSAGGSRSAQRSEAGASSRAAHGAKTEGSRTKTSKAVSTESRKKSDDFAGTPTRRRGASGQGDGASAGETLSEGRGAGGNYGSRKKSRGDSAARDPSDPDDGVPSGRAHRAGGGRKASNSSAKTGTAVAPPLASAMASVTRAASIAMPGPLRDALSSGDESGSPIGQGRRPLEFIAPPSPHLLAERIELPPTPSDRGLSAFFRRLWLWLRQHFSA